jgi:uncharacterized membrane protein HdeD (DUF308 family)
MSGEFDRRTYSPDGAIERMETHNDARQQGMGWIIGIGILMIILGIVAIAEPLVASIALELLLGVILAIGGVIQLVYAFRSHGAGSLALKIVLGLLYLATGLLLLFNPIAGVISLTLLVGIFFFIEGVLRVFLAFQIKPISNWGLILLNGIISIVLGILIWSQWPSNAGWILGLLVGIGLLVNGIATILFSRTFHRTIV